MKKIVIGTTLLLLVMSAIAQNDKQAAAEQEIIKLSNAWMKATMNRDEKTLNKIVAPEFKLEVQI